MKMISRRTAAIIVGSAWLGRLRGESEEDEHGLPDKEAGAAWMDAWMRSETERRPEGELYVGRFADPIYFLTEQIMWKPNPGQEKYTQVTVPVGFVTDLASIPRIFWSALRPDGEYAYCAIVHDYMYWFQMRSREESDTIFKLGMEDFSIDRVTVGTIFRSVRAAGGAAWSQNARLRKAGEKRVLKKYPKDPRTTWSDWKKHPDVFV